MGVPLVYLKLEIKRSCKIIPYFLTGAIVLALLLGTIAFLASRVMYGDSAIGRIKIGVIIPKDDLTADKALSMLTSLDSVKSLCDFEYVDEEEGKELLKSGKIFALMLIPEGMIRDILNGTNTPVTIIVPESEGLETQVFRELADAGARTLSVAQAAVYAVDAFLRLHGLEELIPNAEIGVNKIFLKYALPREEYFKSRQVLAAGDIPMLAYYGISMAVMFLLLCGIPACALLKPDSRVLQSKLKLMGIGRIWVVAARVAAVAVLLILLITLLTIVAIITGTAAFTWQLIPVMAGLCLASSAMIVFAYELSGSPAAGVMLLFWTVVGMMFLSGGFIPSVFLPGGIRGLGMFMPTTLLIRMLKGFVTGEISWPLVTGVYLMGIGFYTAAVCVRRSDG